MKVIFESLAEFFSDEAEMMLFGIGPYAPLPPQYTYIKKTGEILDCSGICIGHAKNEKEFRNDWGKGHTFVVV
jgi:hypothetical protein